MRPFCCSISVARILRVSSLKLKYFKLNGICVILYVTNLKGERSDGEYRGSFLGLGLPGVEIRGLLPLSIFTLTSVSEYSLFVWSHKFTLIYATAIKCSVSIKSYQAFTSPRSTFIAEERTEKYLTSQTKIDRVYESRQVSIFPVLLRVSESPQHQLLHCWHLFITKLSLTHSFTRSAQAKWWDVLFVSLYTLCFVLGRHTNSSHLWVCWGS